MSLDSVVVPPDLTLPVARKIFAEFNFRHLPVADQEKMIHGILIVLGKTLIRSPHEPIRPLSE